MIKRMWELKQKVEFPNILELYIYGDVEADGYDWWTGKNIESETSANHFRDELAKYKSVENIHIFINSNGGSVFEGTAIYNQLKRHGAYKTAFIDGFACSIAAVIAMSADKVVMPRNSMMMIHHAWMYTAGNAEQLRKAADDLDQINKGNRQAFMNKINITEDELIKLMDKESYLTAEDCVNMGFADEYAEKDIDMDAAKAMLQKANDVYKQYLLEQRSLVHQMQQLNKESVQQLEEPKPIEEPKDHQNKLGDFFMKFKN